MPHNICDFDTRQGTSAAWLPRCLEERFEPANSVNAFKAAGPALAQKVHYDLLIIHAPARASDGIQRVAERSSFVVQPTTPALENLAAVKRLFDELIKTGIPKVRIVFALNHVLTVAEEQAAREFLREAGYEVLSGFLPAKTSYRDAQDHSLSVTQIRHEELNAKAFPAVCRIRETCPPAMSSPRAESALSGKSPGRSPQTRCVGWVSPAARTPNPALGCVVPRLR